MIGTFCCPEFPYRELSLCRSQEYSHGPRNSEKAKSTNVAKDFDKVPCCGAQDWHGRAFRFSGKCHNTGLIESRNRRAAREFRLCNAQRSPKNHGNSAQSFSNHENKPNKRQGKSPRPRASKRVIFSSSTRCFWRQSSTFCLPSASTLNTLSPPEGLHLTRNTSGLSAEYIWEFFNEYPNKNRKNFSRKKWPRTVRERVFRVLT